MSPTPTGGHQRIRMQPVLAAVELHGTVVPGSFNFRSGIFDASFDVQAQNDPPFTFTPVPGQSNTYTDQNGDTWTLIQ